MNVNNRLTKSEWLFMGYFSLITLGKSIGLNADSEILKIITILAIVLVIVKLITTHYTHREIIICFVLCGIGLTSYVVTKREGVLLSIITIIALKNISYHKVFLVALKLRAIAFISLITFSLLNIIENVKIVQWREDVGSITRYGLGYNHPNLLHTNLFVLIVLFIYLYYEKLNIRTYVAILIVNSIIYYFSVSRTGYYAIILMVLTTVIMKNKKSIGKIGNRIFLMVIPMCIIFTIATALVYDKIEIINKLDQLFSGRIYFSNYFLTYYSINMFGYNLSNERNLLDNGYVMILINYGIIIFSLYVISYYKIVKKFIKLKLNKELLMISFFAIYGITEGYLPNIFLNLSLMFINTLIFNNIKEGKNNDEKTTLQNY